MLRKIVLVLLFLSIISIYTTPMIQAEEKVNGSKKTIYINNEKFNYEYGAIELNNAIYVPMWGVFSRLGISPQVDKTYLTYRVNTSKNVIFFKADSNVIFKVGLNVDNFETKDKSHSPSREFVREVTRLDYYPITVNNVIYVPLVFLVDYLDLKVVWSKDGKIEINGGDYKYEESLQKLYQDWEKKLGKIGSSYLNYWYEDNYEKFKRRYFDNGFMFFPLDLYRHSQLTEFYGKDLWIYRPSSFWFSTDIPNLTKVRITYIGDGSMLVNDGKNDYKVSIDFLRGDASTAFLTEDPFKQHKWSEKVWNAIRAQEIFIGMNEEMVILSVGHPTRKNITKSSTGTFAQWVYGNWAYLYFKNGKLTTIQQ